MTNTDKTKAMVATVAFHALLLLGLVLTCLTFPPAERPQWPPADESEILFETFDDPTDVGMKVLQGDAAEPMADEAGPSDIADDSPTQPGVDPSNAGQAAEPNPPVASKRPSPAKVEEKPKGPTAEEIAAQQEAKRQQQAAQNVSSKMKDKFSGKGQGQGKTGAPEGNDPQAGALSGAPGNGVSGRTLEHWTTVKSAKTGEIAVRVKVGPDGHVTQATYEPGRSSGSVAADVAMRERCVKASRSCRFSVIEGSAEQSGTITWHFH